jgi:hypothetical protein
MQKSGKPDLCVISSHWTLYPLKRDGRDKLGHDMESLHLTPLVSERDSVIFLFQLRLSSALPSITFENMRSVSGSGVRAGLGCSAEYLRENERSMQ